MITGIISLASLIGLGFLLRYMGLYFSLGFIFGIMLFHVAVRCQYGIWFGDELPPAHKGPGSGSPSSADHAAGVPGILPLGAPLSLHETGGSEDIIRVLREK